MSIDQYVEPGLVGARSIHESSLRAAMAASRGPEEYTAELDRYIEQVFGPDKYDVVIATQTLAMNSVARQVGESRFVDSDDSHYAATILLANEAVRPGTKKRTSTGKRLAEIAKLSDKKFQAEASAQLEVTAQNFMTGEDLTPKDPLRSSKIFEIVRSRPVIGGQLGDLALDTFERFMATSKKAPLLTAPEERLLGRAVQLGNLAGEEIAEGSEHSKVVMQKLIVASAIGRRASRLFTEANLRLVASRLPKYNSSSRNLPQDDILEEGNLGLMNAVERFDPERGNRFSTFGVWWINQAMGRAVANLDRSVRVPTQVVQVASSARAFQQRFLSEHGHMPTIEEIAESGIAKGDIKKIQHALSSMRPIDSLDRKIGNEEESDFSLGDTFADEASDAEYELAERAAELNRLYEKTTLGDKGWQFLSLRYGVAIQGLIGTDLVGGHEPYNRAAWEAIENQGLTLERIGAFFGFGRERARQLENYYLDWLREQVSDESA